MNLNFMLAGALSINPTLFVLSIGIVLAHRIAGRIGADHYALPIIRRTFRSRGTHR
jgi:thiosulfate dehydrogenase [quinone] large subunit